MDKKYFQEIKNLRIIEAKHYAHLEPFGDELAKRRGYKGLKGLEAIHFFLVEKYHWLPATVRSLNPNDLLFLLTEEMRGWTLPEELRD